MGYPAGSTYKSLDENNMTGYKVLIEHRFWFLTKEQVYFHCEWNEEWQKSMFTRRELKLVKI